mmetsp:Transcript_14362/g.19654  ORF Transcript_14362/g.19654 Transcript_14362/m.19654 type:complete len:200 (-) Transcript_14362:2565-3164(-)
MCISRNRSPSASASTSRHNGTRHRHCPSSPTGMQSSKLAADEGEVCTKSVIRTCEEAAAELDGCSTRCSSLLRGSTATLSSLWRRCKVTTTNMSLTLLLPQEASRWAVSTQQWRSCPADVLHCWTSCNCWGSQSCCCGSRGRSCEVSSWLCWPCSWPLGEASKPRLKCWSVLMCSTLDLTVEMMITLHSLPWNCSHDPT